VNASRVGRFGLAAGRKDVGQRRALNLAQRAVPFLLPVAIALHAIALASLHFGYLNPLFNDAENRLGQGSDFFAIYQAGHNFIHGISVYAEGHPAVPYDYPFRYLPFTGFTLGAVLNLLPPWPAYWTWVSVNEVLLALNIACTWRFAPTPPSRTLGACMWLLFTPLYLELFMGQFSFLMATLFFWLGLSLVISSPKRSFLSWTLSLLVKTNSLLFLPIFWKLGWRKGVIIALGIVALLSLPYFFIVEGSLKFWLGNFDFLEGRSVIDPHAGNLGLPALLRLPTWEPGESALEHDIVRAAGLPWPVLILLLTGAATMLSSYRHRLRLLALWICTYFLIFGEVWEHHYVMLLPALVLLVLFDEELRWPALGAFVLIALPTPYGLFRTSLPPLNYEVTDPQHFWTTLQVYAQHLTKITPTALLWLLLAYKVSCGDQGSLVDNLKLNLRHVARRIEKMRRTHSLRQENAGKRPSATPVD
jgi:hypothetical protein